MHIPPSILRVAEFLKLRKKPVPVWKKWLAWGLLVFLALWCGLGIAVAVFNRIENRKDRKIEVTFVDPRQAIIFWTTDTETKGFVRYGASPHQLNQTAYQTSSEPGTIHAVLLTDVPLGGLYYSLHTESDSFLLWPKVNHMVFDPTTIE